ncbi:hypothetical protein ASG48_08800 [Aurantimonas sp. Leaf443]|nr:hypothetical protein ASG48_08800 [Aurantimonas sp. Leaf443]
MDGGSGALWRWAAFDELTGREVHDLLRLRAAVFVVEQACAFAEIDGRDPHAFHLRWIVGRDLAACLRVLPPEGSGGRPCIGRVASAKGSRGAGLGHRMMEEALAFCARRFPGLEIDLSAQAHLQPFYARHGFAAVSDPYLEDDIPHVDMRRPA